MNLTPGNTDADNNKDGFVPDEHRIRVMIVDDSAVIRGFLSRSLAKDPAINVVSSLANGELALKALSRTQPDIIILDIEMPVMDGLTAIPLLLEQDPDVKILMCSALSQKGATVSLKALSLGATDYIVKPSSTGNAADAVSFEKKLLQLIHMLGREKTKRSSSPARTSPAKPASSATAVNRHQKPVGAPKPPTPFTLYKAPHTTIQRPKIIAIGSSTGGPNALYEVLGHFKSLNLPIVITQHMPKTFTAILAQHIQQNSGIPTKEAADGDLVQNGHAYVAPGGYHMRLKKGEDAVKITLSDDPPVNYCKPAVDPMFEDIAAIYGARSLAIILTGMGQDGLEGSKTLVKAGGRLIAQDEQSSVVWGMPGAVARAGICTAVLPLKEIGPWIKEDISAH